LGFPDLGETIEGHRFVIAPPGLPKEINNLLVNSSPIPTTYFITSTALAGFVAVFLVCKEASCLIFCSYSFATILLGSMMKFSFADLEKRLNALEARIKALEKMVFP
jgi:hypothetical protein